MDHDFQKSKNMAYYKAQLAKFKQRYIFSYLKYLAAGVGRLGLFEKL